jgi:hypothetical protein
VTLMGLDCFDRLILEVKYPAHRHRFLALSISFLIRHHFLLDIQPQLSFALQAIASKP